MSTVILRGLATKTLYANVEVVLEGEEADVFNELAESDRFDTAADIVRQEARILPDSFWDVDSVEVEEPGYDVEDDN